MAAMSADVTPGEPVVKLGQFVLSGQIHLLIRLPCSYNGKNNNKKTKRAAWTQTQAIPGLAGWSTICCSTITPRHRFTWAVGNGCPHVHEAQGAAGQRLPAAGAASDFGLGWRAADAVLAEAAALVRHRRAAVRDGLAAEVAAHKHLSHGSKHKGQADKGEGGTDDRATAPVHFRTRSPAVSFFSVNGRWR